VGTRSLAAIAALTCRPVPGYRRDHAVEHFADTIVAPIGDVKSALGIEGDCRRRGQLGSGGGAAIAAEPGCASPGDGDQNAVRKLANAVTSALGEVEIAGRVEGYAERTC